MRRSVFSALSLLCVSFCISCTCSPKKAPVLDANEAFKMTSLEDEVRARRSRPSSELNRKSPIGSNIATVVDYSVDMPFVDLFRSSRPWISGSGATWDDGRSIDVDQDGWVRSLKPGQVARTLMLTKGGHPGGEFIALYDGEGQIDFDHELLEQRSRPGRQ